MATFGFQLLVGALMAVLIALNITRMPKTTPEFAIQFDPLLQAPAVALGSTLTLLGLFAWLSRRRPWALRTLGWVGNRRDVALGLKWAILLIPVTILVAALVDQFVEYEHQAIDAVRLLERPETIIIHFLTTALIVPIIEETLYRGLLQGSLEHIARAHRHWKSMLSADDRASRETVRETTRLALFRESQWPPTWRARSVWPVVVTAAIFASMHVGQGAAPIPLFVFALGLGFLFRQTGSLWPPIVVHMTLNSLTLIQVLLLR